MDEIVKMSLEDLPQFVNDDDPELAIARLMFLSTRPNSHGFTITENVLMEYAPTVLGKFLIGNLNMWESDVTTHLQEPNIFGYMPTNQEIEFVRALDGYLDAYVNAVVSKVYATKVYNLFTQDNFRNVSVEMTLRYSDEQNKIVERFNICGVTILGKEVNPSVPKAHMEIVRFSADEAEKFYRHSTTLDKMAKLANANQYETEVLSKLNSIYNKLNLNETDNNEEQENKMAKLAEQENGVVMGNPTEDTENKEQEKLSEDAENKDSEEKASEESTKCAEPKEDEKPADNEDDKKEEEEKASEDSNKEEEDDKLAQSEAHCAELEAKCAELEAKLSELEKFKADTENKEKMSIVTQTLAQVKESMDENTYAKFEAKANDCDINTINAWRNEVLANVATVLMSKQKDESHLRMDVETPDNTPKGLWDRM